jgi:hypothetical protein
MVTRYDESSVPVLRTVGIVGVLACLIGLLGCGGDVARAEGRIFCVSTTGSDGNSGSCSAPWRTIQKAVETLLPGQTALVRGGVYRENVVILRGGEGSRHLSVRAYADERPVLRGQLKISGSNVRVEGLTINGRGVSLLRPLVYIERGRSIVVERLEVTGSRHSGVFVGGNSRDVTVIACWVHDNGSRDRLDHGIAFGHGSRGEISSNVVEGNLAGGIQVYPRYDDVLVNQNTVVANGGFGILVGGERATSDDVTVVNNIVAFNGGQGIRTFWGGTVGTGNLAANNIIWRNGEDDVSREGITQQGNLRIGPGFGDAGAGDYRLLRRSSAVGQALGRYTARIDRAGRPRPQGQRPDLGAYER